MDKTETIQEDITTRKHCNGRFLHAVYFWLAKRPPRKHVQLPERNLYRSQCNDVKAPYAVIINHSTTPTQFLRHRKVTSMKTTCYIREIAGGRPTCTDNNAKVVSKN